MEEKLDIIPGRAADLDELAALYDELNDHLAAHTNFPGWIKGIYPIRESAEDGLADNSLFVARIKDKIVGSIILNHRPEEAYNDVTWLSENDYARIFVIHTLTVHPRYQKRGIAEKLLAFAEEEAMQKNIRALRLDVYQHNAPAIALYEKMGYKYVGRVDLGLRETFELDWFKLYERIPEETTVLKKWELADAALYSEIMNNKKVQDNLRDGLPFPYTAADAEAYISSVLAAPEGCQYSWAICVNGKVAGSIGIFRNANIHSRTAEMGYCLGESYWGRGIVTRAVSEACQYVFENTDIVRISAEPFADNTGSCRVLEKAGFKLEGILRKNAVKNGRIIDMKLYALVKE